MNAENISSLALALGYLMLIAPIAIALWVGAPLFQPLIVSVLRMTVQLLFIGFYLQWVFEWNQWWLNLLWLLVMAAVADASVVSGCGVKARRFAAPLFLGLLAGTALPLFYCMAVILRRPNWFDARHFIPLAGMIMGNCLRANIVGLSDFYKGVKTREKAFQLALAQGARLSEALRPHFAGALKAALQPTIATMATIGLVSLPGMMTGVMLGGAAPMTAIKYQIAIMIAIYTGTAITVSMVIALTIRTSFTRYGILDRSIYS